MFSPFMNTPRHYAPNNNRCVMGYQLCCHLCQCIKRVHKQVQVQFKSAHKIRNRLSMYVDTTYCRICFEEFLTRECVGVKSY